MGNFITLELGSIFTCQDCSIGSNASGLRDIEDNLDALQRKWQDLSLVKDDVKRKIDDIPERRAASRSRSQMELWVTRVETVETQVGEVQRLRSQEIGKLCLGGFCSKNPMSSYKYKIRVAKLLKELGDLKAEEETFVDVAETIPEDPVVEFACESTVGLESHLEEVWSYIGEQQVKIIGLYGKGGVGKTTLLTQVNNKFLNLSDNFIVIWVTASKDIRLENIQETIGKKIGLLGEWNNKSLEEKARDIFSIFSRKKFVLLLDDIWERVDLIKIGIPPPSHAIDFKVIFTTRSFKVCSRMEPDKTVEVQCLKHEEAWRLFQEKVGEETLNSHPDIPTLAEQVAREFCGGLPLALITIGRAMAGKHQLEEWEFAISILRDEAHEFPGMQDDVFCLLKFSYDFLPSDIERSCFLYCSLFPEDFHISKRDLIDCWISEGFLKKYDGIKARKFGYHVIGVLLHACLLEEGRNDKFVQMHDVIRDMALWIAYEVEKERKFLVCSGAGLDRAPAVEEWENVKRMSLMENKIASLSMPSDCPELLTLFLHRNPLEMLNGFFQYVPHLQVLNLSKTRLTELPKGISKLVELRHLDVSFTPIKELPEELKALANLKCLNLEGAKMLHKIPLHVISNLLMLQVLRMYECGSWINTDVFEDGILFDKSILFIEELIHLKHLNVLNIHFNNSLALQRYLNSYELESCSVESISLGLDWDSRPLNVLSLEKLKDLHTLHISTGVNSIDCEIRNVPQFNSLYKVELYCCRKLRDATWLIFAPKLQILEIEFCNDMKEIISFGDEMPEIMRNLLPFARLERLHLYDLEKLESIYCSPLTFLHLKEIYTDGCPSLKKLPLDANSMTNRALKIRGEQQWWNELQWDDQATRNHFHPYFEVWEFRPRKSMFFW